MQREDIILAAAQIFRQKGYHAASMQDIAESVRLQKGSLYHHIRSKQDILLEILDRALAVLIGDLQPIVASDLPADQKLRKAMQTYIGRMTQNADLAAVMLLEHRSLEPGLRAGHGRGYSGEHRERRSEKRAPNRLHGGKGSRRREIPLPRRLGRPGPGGDREDRPVALDAYARVDDERPARRHRHRVAIHLGDLRMVLDEGSDSQ